MISLAVSLSRRRGAWWFNKAGSLKLEAGSWKLEAGSWKLEDGSKSAPSSSPFRGQGQGQMQNQTKKDK